MGFFKEVEQAITEKALNETQRRSWLELANRHFKGELLLLELPACVGAIIVEIEEMYATAMEELNTKYREDTIREEVYYGR